MCKDTEGMGKRSEQRSSEGNDRDRENIERRGVQEEDNKGDGGDSAAGGKQPSEHAAGSAQAAEEGADEAQCEDEIARTEK